MDQLEWKSEFSVGNDYLDNQHKNIIKAINALAEALDSGQANKMLAKLHMALFAYSERHFSYEEKLLEILNYPELAQHKKAHTFFVEKVNEMRSTIEQSEDLSVLGDEMLDFLKSWLFDHIAKMDQDYADFLARNADKLDSALGS